ncbi:MAG TPA: glycoside hydrolase family 5 protein [Fimbriimonas sp.]
MICSAAIAVLALSLSVGPEVPGQPTTLTSGNYLQELSPGLNLGNTLEAIPTETSWGNPKTSKSWFQAVKSAGFKSVRIPVAWSQYSDSLHRVAPDWMDNVTDVVRKTTDAGLYAVVNIHWDGGWMQPTYARREAVNEKFAKLWAQIATNFRDFDDRLLFAGTNEIHVEGNYESPTPENAEVQNGFNQVFVDVVRSTGGRNKDRWLVVQGYNTNIDDSVKFNSKLPDDSAKGRLMMEVHYYSPYNFTLNEKSDVWQWGAGAKDPKASEDWANEAYVDAQFQSMKKAFVDRGVPVLLGEYAVGLKPKYPGMKRYQRDWVSYVTRSAHRHGLVPMYWDIGLPSGLFNRSTGAQQDQELIRTIVESAK